MCRIQLQEEENKAVKAYAHSSIEEFSEISNIENITLAPTGFTFQLNAALRANLQLSNETIGYITQLDHAFQNHQIAEDIIVYRACNYLEMFRYINGTSYIDLGYMSTSKLTSSIYNFFEKPKIGYQPAFLTIIIPAGSNVLDLDKINDFDNTTYENEILLKRKSVFDILFHTKVSTETLQDVIGIEVQQDFDALYVLELRFRNYLP